MNDYSFVANADPKYIEYLYEQHLAGAEGVDSSCKDFFKGFQYALDNAGGVAATGSGDAGAFSTKEFQVYSLIVAYRSRGHLVSDTNPIAARRDRKPNLTIDKFRLAEADLDTHFLVGQELGLQNATLRDIVAHLQKVYCGKIGFEFHQIADRDKRRWLRTRIERLEPEKQYNLSLDKKRRILEKLNGAVGFERFLHAKYPGQKRFSLEGGEGTIAAMDGIINKGAEMGVQEFVIGMAHRGRLNVLANVMGKTYKHIFNEFEGTAVPDLSFGDGDVKYHMGYSSQVETTGGQTVHLKLVPNPSHLESVNPVVEGFSRAKIDILYGEDEDKILPILIHGDAAAAGQGVVYETVQMSQLKGYKTGGTFHFVINNQIGFTTDFDDARSSTYCTAAANMVQAPVFHVNGDDPEAILFAVEMAMEYRQEFNSDVFVDMVCYRKYGHNEGDDPQFTQPLMYESIKDHPDPRKLYSDMLVSRGDLEKGIADELEASFTNDLNDRLDELRQNPLPYSYQEPEQAWRLLQKTINPADFEQSPETGIKKEALDHILLSLMDIPQGFNPLPKVGRLMNGFQKSLDNNAIDWGMAELAAYGSILLEGKDVRMSGQDVKRGTFSHRHAILRDAETQEEYVRLSRLSETQGKFRIFNSLLSEFAVLGFEYGYSLATPDTLVLWEAQFGDFSNGAQTIIDQYIYAAESKWQRMSGLVMLLPHGYEGQGPEHSSARLERFLQSSAEYNVTVANVTTPANFFHLLRRQLARPFRKPLIVMSPKSMLRHPDCISPKEDFATGSRFQETFDDASISEKEAGKVKRVLLCTGKIYYDLLAKQRETGRKDVAIVRLEQLYPLPSKQLQAIFDKYKKAELLWVQEEPYNMGAWFYIYSNLTSQEFGVVKNLRCISRKPSASPATGFKKVHDAQQIKIVEDAFDL